MAGSNGSDLLKHFRVWNLEFLRRSLPTVVAAIGRHPKLECRNLGAALLARGVASSFCTRRASARYIAGARFSTQRLTMQDRLINAAGLRLVQCRMHITDELKLPFVSALARKVATGRASTRRIFD
jgi:hypothetical protein